jgi:hypothetical protein
MKLGKQLKFLIIIFFTNLFLSSFFLINISYAQISDCAADTSNTGNCTGPLEITHSGETIVNSGAITITVPSGNAYGISRTSEHNNNNTIINSGTITTTVIGDGNSFGIFEYGETNNNYNKITNSGTITSTLAGDGQVFGIFNNSSNYNTIINSGTITTTATNGGTASGIKNNSSNFNKIINSGTITTTATNGGIASGIFNEIGSNNTITNSGTITVSTSGASAYAHGIFSMGAVNTITNSGTITLSTEGADADAYGIFSYGDNNIITNSGTITVSTSGANAYAHGIFSNGAVNTITNSGTITASTIGDNARAYGIYSVGNTNTITNSGTITVSISEAGTAVGIRSIFDGNTITNSGTITVSGGNSNTRGIYSEGEFNTITNSGTITVSNTGGAYGIYSSGTGDTITNSGRITAETAIYSEGGSLNILPNSYIDGTISLSGTDVNITTGPSHSIYYNLGVTPTFSGPTPGFINETRAATFDPTVFKGSINELADLNNNIASAANKNLSNFKDRQFSTSVFASQLEHKADAVNLKQEIDQLGVVFAYDYKLADTNLNFMAGYANSDLEANSRFAKSYANKSKGPFIGVAGIYDAGLVNVNFGLTTGLLKHSHDRFVNDNEETNGEDHAKANYDSMFIAPEIGVSKKIKSNDITFSPKANVRYNYQSVDGYTETGSNSNATVKSLDVGLVETNLELAGTKSLNQSSYTIKTGYLNRQSVGDHKATVTMIGQTNSIGFGDKSNNIYYAGVGADLNLANFKLSFDLNQYLGDAEGFQGIVKLSNNF